MAKLRLKIDPERIFIDDLIALEEGTMKTRAARDLIAKFVVDADGTYLSDEEGRAAIGKLSLAELAQVSTQLTDQIQNMMVTLVPTKTASG